tara:strand:- start:2133 stop:2417 length:285 start_codon:yes stop_codon:yes gene_type:complete
MAKKSKQIKFTDEEIKSLQDLQTSYTNVRASFGDLEIQRIQTEQRLEQIHNEKLRLETEYSKLNMSEQTLVNDLNEKYGPGNLDPTSGVFTPTK